MAEIKVEPKRGGLGWLWAIVVLALIGAAVWYFMNNTQAAPATSPADSVRTSRSTVIDAPSPTMAEATSHG
jgi:cytoskeletal protein RodZ